MPSTSVPKYQAIHSVLRQQILDGDLVAGSQLPPQQQLADRFGVTLMTLRQAIAQLESEDLVRAERGRGTFVSDRPVDLSIGNLSSFSSQMRAAGIKLTTRVLDDRMVVHDAAALALGEPGSVRCLTRLRLIRKIPIALQRSYLAESVPLAKGSLKGASLYDAIESAMGWTVSRALETISAVGLDDADAAVLDATSGAPALLSVRTSLNQFDQPFLYDEALLVGGRSAIAADRTADRLSISYGQPG